MSHSLQTTHPILISMVTSAFLFSVLACAGGLPAVLSATPDEVSIEFESDSSVTSTRELAAESCASYEKVAQFEAVDQTATSRSRVAKYGCVPPEGQHAADAEAAVEATKVAAEAKIRGETEAARAAAEAVTEAQAAAQAIAETPPVSAAPAIEAAGSDSETTTP